DDSAQSPGFVDTLPRHCYRFVGSLNGSRQIPVAEAKSTSRLRLVRRAGSLGALAVIATAAMLVGLNVRGWRDRLLKSAPKPQIQTLAVLPFTNLSGDPEQEYFANGTTESLITEFGKISNPRVSSRQSVMKYKASKEWLQETA